MSPTISFSFFLLSDIVCWSFSRKIRERKTFFIFFAGSRQCYCHSAWKRPQPGILKTKCAFWHHCVSSVCLHLTAIPPPEFLAEEFEGRLTFRVAAKPISPNTGKSLASVAVRRFTKTVPRGLALTCIVCWKNQKCNVFFEDFFNYFLRFFFTYIVYYVLKGCRFFLKQTCKNKSPRKCFQGLLFSLQLLSFFCKYLPHCSAGLNLYRLIQISLHWNSSMNLKELNMFRRQT